MSNRKFIPEILSEINENPTLLTTKYSDDNALRIIFEYSFLPDKKFSLPAGTPPFKPDQSPIGMAESNLLTELRRLYIFTPQRELHPVRRETLFIQLLESLHPSEAALLCAVKDQTLDKLYPNVTRDLVATCGYIPSISVVETKKSEDQESEELKKSRRAGSKKTD
jgi:hypothetical protein